MKALDVFRDQPYLNLETYRRNGKAEQTPVWFVQVDETFYIRTMANSGKVKRMRNHPGVRLAPCGREGQLLAPWMAATGHEVSRDPALEAEVDRLLEVKYGELKRQLTRQAREAGQVYTILKVNLDE
jgi:uncharacterized protein